MKYILRFGFLLIKIYKENSLSKFHFFFSFAVHQAKPFFHFIYFVI